MSDQDNNFDLMSLNILMTLLLNDVIIGRSSFFITSGS